MIEERIRSKEEKLKDMHVTRKQLEEKLQKEEKKQEKINHQKKVQAKSKEIKAKIADDIQNKQAELADQASDLEKAAAELQTTKKPQEDNLVEAITSTLGDAVENVVDTVKAVAEVVGDRLEETIESLTEEE